LRLDKFQSEVFHFRFVPLDLIGLFRLSRFGNASAWPQDPHNFDFINKAAIRNDFVEFPGGLRFFGSFFLQQNS
jgi:hypothetical protein